MPKLTPETQQARKQQIITAALDCYRKKGFAATSMTDIIKTSGLSSGSIYSHFKSKDEILQGASAYAFGALTEILTNTQNHHLSPRAIFLKILTDHPMRDRFGILLQFFGEAGTNSPVTEIVQQNIARAQQSFADLLLPWAETQEGNPIETAARAANQLMLVFHGFIVRTTIDPTADRKELTQAGATLLPA